jgi:energy-coupling factor transport system ATP-binding protein
MEPAVLILDEPTAGLDPEGRREILGMVSRLHRERQMTVILVSHSMDDVAEYADRIMVLNHGELAYFDTPREVFRHHKELETFGLSAPEITYLAAELADAGFDIDRDISTVEEAKAEILRIMGS